MAAEWTPFTIPFVRHGARITRPTLETVYHIAHVQAACRVLQDGYVKAGLVYDASRLQTSRLSVAWLSANDWWQGSIYGNVRFAFRWEDLIRGREFYWVEAITRYKPPAYRILLTDRELSGSTDVMAYDPIVDDGPLRLQDGMWYWNADYTSEFLVDDNLLLSQCVDLSFVDHHAAYCNLNGSGCPDLGQMGRRAAGRALAYLLGGGIHKVDHILCGTSTVDSEGVTQVARHAAVDQGVREIERVLAGADATFEGPIESPQSTAVLKGALALYGLGDTTAARSSVGLLRSRGAFDMALTAIVEDHFEASLDLEE